MSLSSSIWVCASCGAIIESPARSASWCVSCGCVGLWRHRQRREVGEALAAAERPVTAALALLVGGPGAGTSTLAVQVAAQLSPVLVLSAEEAPGPALARRLVLAGMGQRGDVLVVRNPAVEELAAHARQGGAIVIDSVTATQLQPSDLHALLNAGTELVPSAMASTTGAPTPRLSSWASLSTFCSSRARAAGGPMHQPQPDPTHRPGYGAGPRTDLAPFAHGPATMTGFGRQAFYAGLDEALPAEPGRWEPAPDLRAAPRWWATCLVLGFAGARALDKWAGEIR